MTPQGLEAIRARDKQLYREPYFVTKGSESVIDRRALLAYVDELLTLIEPKLDDISQVAVAEMNYLRERIAEMEWRPISTAPKDVNAKAMFWVRPLTIQDDHFADTNGQPILFLHEPYIHMGGYGTWSSLSKATHWMPLPEPPKENE